MAQALLNSRWVCHTPACWVPQRGSVASTSAYSTHAAYPPPATCRTRARRVAHRCQPLCTDAIGHPFTYPGEYSFNLSEYSVELEKPIGLTLAPDPRTGQILVHQVMEGSPAADCKLIQVM
eukprot:jgi/Chrzof1/15123/Cz09g28020.t1